jgi:hypothetical protein
MKAMNVAVFSVVGVSICQCVLSDDERSAFRLVDRSERLFLGSFTKPSVCRRLTAWFR